MSSESFWILFGFFGQGLFFSRFLVQWIASERQKQSVIPVSFWYLSIAGATIVGIYAVQRQDPVFITSSFLSLGIYLRNLRLIKNTKDRVPNS